MRAIESQISALFPWASAEPFFIALTHPHKHAIEAHLLRCAWPYGTTIVVPKSLHNSIRILMVTSEMGAVKPEGASSSLDTEPHKNA